MAVAVLRIPSIGIYLQIRGSNLKKKKRVPPPVFISTNPSHVNHLHLRDLFCSSNLSCLRFPNLDPHGRVEPVDLDKLRIALSNSSVIVSVFCKPHFSSGHRSKDETTISKSEFGFGELFERALPVTESNGQLVGFGRAVSDNGLTASIYDVMVSLINLIGRFYQSSLISKGCVSRTEDWSFGSSVDRLTSQHIM
ncbi:hypothetical protein HHK36_018724 [Tetracentron sinense]|uniref:Glucosamine-phosphate N-acetyltransferase n=1 Tax=Tetracentron sinense TaxID=13715 RepID=A0A835D8I1_TETSI|nr:hypothetical protein HHK36_018724 [Tetracentron sinense]